MKTRDYSAICPLCLQERAEDFAEVHGSSYLRCQNCSLIFVHPSGLPSREQEEKRYQFHQNETTNPEYCAYIRKLLTPLLESITERSLGLDYGCGPSKIAERILGDIGISAESFDPFYFSNSEILNQQYDFIFCSEVIEHFHHPKEEFDKLDGLLRRGGLLEIVTGIYQENQKFQDWWYVRDSTHVAFYSEKSFQWIANHYKWDREYLEGNVIIFRKEY